MRKFLFITFTLTMFGCGDLNKKHLQDNIDRFTNSCKEVANCLELDYSVKIKLDSELFPLVCNIKFSEFTSISLYPGYLLNIEASETYIYGQFNSAVEICRALKKKGEYSDKNQDKRYRYNKCIELNLDDKEHKDACWKQYQMSK